MTSTPTSFPVRPQSGHKPRFYSIPVARWTRYGRWSDDGTTLYASNEGVARFGSTSKIFTYRA